MNEQLDYRIGNSSDLEKQIGLSSTLAIFDL
jgi:hypothetical protein